VINVNTVAKVYRELEHEGVIELRHGMGAFVTEHARNRRRPDVVRHAQELVDGTIGRLRARGISDEEIRRLVEAALARVRGARRG